jgi:signal peptide peptidase SppA
MRHTLLIAEFLSTPWALMPERLSAFAGIIARWSADIRVDEDTLNQVRADAAVIEARRDESARTGNGAIAVLPMYGVVAQRSGGVRDVSGPGVMSTEAFGQSLRTALADDSIGAILIDVDSPGGSVYGVAELADEIYSARSKKPIVALANSLAASAAYWLGSSAGEFYVTPGGEVGSIGVLAAHEDLSKKLEAQGVNTTLVSAGKYKAEGSPFQPLTQDAREALQARVNEYYGTFTRAVARNRNTDVATVRNGMGEGRVMNAQAARGQNMVDGVATFDQVVHKMMKTVKQGGTTSSKASARMSFYRRDLELL